MKNILKTDKLEKLLVASWTQFLDSSKLMAFILKNTRDHIEHLAYVPSEWKRKNIQISISRFQLNATGFIIWVEFSVPLENNQVAVGTTELHLANTGIFTHLKTLGNLHCPSNNI
jgi:hypothetical protein